MAASTLLRLTLNLSNRVKDRSPTEPRISRPCLCMWLRPRPRHLCGLQRSSAPYSSSRGASQSVAVPPAFRSCQLSEQRLGHDAPLCPAGVGRDCHLLQVAPAKLRTAACATSSVQPGISALLQFCPRWEALVMTGKHDAELVDEPSFAGQKEESKRGVTNRSATRSSATWCRQWQERREWPLALLSRSCPRAKT